MQRRRLSSKIKITVNVSRFIADQLTLACKDPSKNKSELTERALKLLLDPERDLSRDGGLQRRLDHLTRRVELIDRHQQVVIESFGLFIQYFLTVTPPLPRSEQDAAKAKGHQRFEAFIAQLGRRIAGSHSLVSEVLEKVAHNDPDLLLRDFDGYTVESRSTSQHSTSQGPAGSYSSRPGRGREAPAPQRESAASSPPDAVPGASSQAAGGGRG
jgi:hypothetical protein